MIRNLRHMKITMHHYREIYVNWFWRPKFMHSSTFDSTHVSILCVCVWKGSIHVLYSIKNVMKDSKHIWIWCLSTELIFCLFFWKIGFNVKILQRKKNTRISWKDQKHSVNRMKRHKDRLNWQKSYFRLSFFLLFC